MVVLASQRDIASLPKVELHIHLNGSISEATAATLARRHGADPDTSLGLVGGRYPGTYADFQGFLDAYLLANSFVRTPDDLEEVAAAFARQQAAEGIRYSEAIVTAMIYVRNGMEPAAMWAALRSGLAAGGPDTRIALVIDVIRDLGRQEAEDTLRLVEAADARIVGLGLTGIEGTVPTEDFVPYRQEARRRGLGCEVPAGERGPPSSIVTALDVLEADRIGHGVAAIRDEAVLARLIRDHVVLDVCPSSNVAIGEFASLEAHPMTEFWRRGVEMTISSDDPPFFGTTLSDELRHLVRIAGLERDDLAKLQRRAATHSFAPPDVRASLLAEIDEWAGPG